VALISVFAAVLLVSTKLVIAILTNSLGILSEALHSGIDLIAAVITLIAVKMADRPPDQDHQYGHMKIESFSSLVETALLFITCAWIVWEALQRLLFQHVKVDVGWIAVAVMLMSIAVDYTRSRALMRAAKRYKSQALEADAIHFSTDMLSSVVVLVGIFATMAGLAFFDSVSALGVAAITAVIGYRLWKRSVHTLLDGAPQGIYDIVIEEAESVDGVLHLENVRVRESGHKTFIDATVHIDGTMPLEQAHRVTNEVALKVEARVPSADIVIHAEPCQVSSKDAVEVIRTEAAKLEEIKNVHNIEISELNGSIQVDLHIELEGTMSVAMAHDIATKLENNIMRSDDRIISVFSHIEPANGRTCHIDPSPIGDRELIDSIGRVVEEHPKVRRLRYMTVNRTEVGWRVNLCCIFDSQMNVSEMHDAVTHLENQILSEHRDVYEVIIHVEPWYEGPSN
jgi:cation diffusion facilitator family transporter